MRSIVCRHSWRKRRLRHNRLNKKADKSHIGFYELLQLLIAEQGVMDTMIQKLLSRNATIDDVRRLYNVFSEEQQVIAQFTDECNNGTVQLLQMRQNIYKLLSLPLC
ncbi:hypothetical protein T11_7591 [Trichinella zimbabwensis]|uniref:Uncharacterized protein n=1 Tax=Trichinella zimbabwensis TaxID=268475 RepID=A0A0V1HTM3_9BILA|nr:hypothetical protein T11_7591 [Trichinella zimbabwensis]